MGAPILGTSLQGDDNKRYLVSLCTTKSADTFDINQLHLVVAQLRKKGRGFESRSPGHSFHHAVKCAGTTEARQLVDETNLILGF